MTVQLTLNGVPAILYRCRVCNDELKGDNWHRSREAMRLFICKQCVRDYYKDHYKKKIETNPNYNRERRAKLFKTNPNHRKEWLANNPNYYKEWYANNTNHIKEYKKNWYDENPNYNKERMRKWRKNNHDKNTDNHRKYRLANLDHIRKLQRNWRKLNVDKMRVLRANRRKMRWYCLIKNPFNIETVGHHLNKWLGLYVPTISHKKNGHSHNIKLLEPLLELWYPDFMRMFHLFRENGLVNEGVCE